MNLTDICKSATDAALAAGASGAEAFATSRKTREVSYEKNDLNMARTDEELSIGIRVLHGNSFGFVTTNEPGSIEAAARQALAIARISHADPNNQLPMPATLLAEKNDLFDPALAALGADDLAGMTCRMVDVVAAMDPRIMIDQVRLSVEEATDAIHSSSGVSASSSGTYLSGFVMGMAIEGDKVGSFTYDGAYGNRRADIEPELMAGARRFVEKALGALSPRKGKSFTGTVILSPETVGELLVEPLLEAISADSIRKGRSPLREKLGALIATSFFTLRDPGSHLGHFGMRAFDREGQQISALELVSGGRLESFLFDSYEARLMNRRSTGHARGGASDPPRLSSGLTEVLPGKRSAAALEASASLALVVPRFSGRVEMATGDFSGVVKGGILIEGGERIPVTETMIAGNLYEALNHIVEVSSDRLQIFGTALLPSVALEGVTVTAG